mgnify:FL=1
MHHAGIRFPFLILFFIGTTQWLYAETITLTTYYPAPFGAYTRMRIVPGPTQIGSCQHGTIYLDQADQTLKYCQDDSSWGLLPGVWKQAGSSAFLTDPNSALKVGIGTETPTSTLHIRKLDEDPGLQVTKTGGSDYSVVSQQSATVMGTTSNTDLDIRTSNTSRIVIASDGSVGIGTATPTNPLEVNGNVVIEGNSDSSFIRFQKNGAWYSVGIDANDGNNFKINVGQTPGDTTQQIILTPQGDLIVHGKIKVKIGTDPLGEVKLRYIDDGANSGYYALYAP